MIENYETVKGCSMRQPGKQIFWCPSALTEICMKLSNVCVIKNNSILNVDAIASKIKLLTQSMSVKQVGVLKKEYRGYIANAKQKKCSNIAYIWNRVLNKLVKTQIVAFQNNFRKMFYQITFY